NRTANSMLPTEPSVEEIIDEECCLSGAFLCAWSDVLGPSLLHTWCKPGTWQSEHTRQLYQQLSKICLSCRVAQPASNADCRRIAHQLLHLPALSVSLFSFTYDSFGCFTSSADHAAAVPAATAFVLVFPQAGYAQFCLPWRPLVCDFFDRNLHLLRARHRLGLQQALSDYGTLIERFAELTEQLEAGRLPEPVPLCRTALAPDRNVEPSFLARAIEGHLSAQGRSLVIGRDRERVNLMLMTLALFNTPAERACSALVAAPEDFGGGGVGMGGSDSGGHFFLQGAAPSTQGSPSSPTATSGSGHPSEPSGLKSGLAVTESVCSPGHCLASPRPLCIVQLRDRSVRRCCLQPLHSLARYCERRALLCGGERRRFSQAGLVTGLAAASPAAAGHSEPLVHRLLSLSAGQAAQLRLFQQRRAKQARLLLHLTDRLPDRIPAAVAQLGCSPAEVRRLVSLAETLRPGAAALLYGDPRLPGGASESEEAL
ncbi:hypothetical protein BOX15_Mlig016868g2, partial [Macrostomum lignano]